MRTKVNDLALDIIHSELVKMQDGELNDKQRQFVLKSYEVTADYDDLPPDTHLNDISSDDLLRLLDELNNNQGAVATR